MDKPLIIINFKNYQKVSGKSSLNFVKKLNKFRKRKYEIILCPTILTTSLVVKNSKFKVFTQFVNKTNYGAHTGNICLDELQSLGVTGCLLNHSEKKIKFDKLTKIVALCKKKKIKTIVCASTLSEVKNIAELKPDYIAYEAKQLIGGNISITEAKPEIILKAVEEVKKISRRTKILCGAGIHSKEDLGHALILGAQGVLIAHSIIESKNPKKFLEEMLI
ncbi:triose-phosphate isomerase [archaeon]|jgi:triosephosphate isomerase (TIM)|nr:triose-phosphate isomerase [archaeon]MBT3451419.1 triose-phosphate isomerase [archaeon]MBT6869236.1 triose-phosphate isomerase [archaeon]MBT7193634.1 triose-phosphate isomerase [archaeon]MBT7380252.1 triose-phosphate isomerase [archaeon]